MAVAPLLVREHDLAEGIFSFAEERLRRPMTDAERRIDVVAARRDLDEGKRMLADAIEEEKVRVIKARLRGVRARLDVTDRMVRALLYCYDKGQQHARAELEQIGVSGHQYAERVLPAQLHEQVMQRLRPMLGGITLRIDKESVGWGIGGTAQSAIVARLAQTVPGALDAASRLVSGGFGSGLNDVFEGAQDSISSWSYTAVMDDSTCDECASHDGEEFDTWADIQDVLPDGGPNPDCYGEGRCRCRPVPNGAAEEPAPSEATPTVEDTGGTAATPPSDFVHLPEHAQQAVETLTIDEARTQLKRLDSYARTLAGHVRAGRRQVHPEKLPALQRRIDELRAYVAKEPRVPLPTPRPEPVPVPRPAPPAPPPVVTPTPAPPLSGVRPFAHLADRTVTAQISRANVELRQLEAVPQYARTREQELRITELRLRRDQLQQERALRKSGGGQVPKGEAPAPPRPVGEVSVRDYMSRPLKRPTTPQGKRVFDETQPAIDALDKMFRRFGKPYEPSEMLGTTPEYRLTAGQQLRPNERLLLVKNANGEWDFAGMGYVGPAQPLAADEAIAVLQRDTVEHAYYVTAPDGTNLPVSINFTRYVVRRDIEKMKPSSGAKRMAVQIKGERRSSWGYYQGTDGVDSSLISLNSSAFTSADSPAETFWHEWGHYLDDQHIRERVAGQGARAYVSELIGSSEEGLPPNIAGFMREWEDAIRSTAAYSKLQSVQGARGGWISHAHAKYLISGRELFARSFSQYVAETLEEMVARDPAAFTEAERATIQKAVAMQLRRAGDSYGSHWTKADFAPVKRAYDRLFRELGWLRPGVGGG